MMEFYKNTELLLFKETLRGHSPLILKIKLAALKYNSLTSIIECIFFKIFGFAVCSLFFELCLARTMKIFHEIK